MGKRSLTDALKTEEELKEKAEWDWELDELVPRKPKRPQGSPANPPKGQPDHSYKFSYSSPDELHWIIKKPRKK